MEMKDIVKNRFSVRKFSDKKVEEEKLQTILEVSKYAPTAMNYQPQKIYVLQSEESIAKINSLCKGIYGASTVLMLCYDEEIACKRSNNSGMNYGELDATIVCDEMMLTAYSLGIGSCWVAAFNPEEVSKAFNLPKNIIPFTLLPIGYAAEDCTASPLHSTTKELDEMVVRL